MHLRIILRNIFSTWVGYVVTLLVGFLLAPFVVHHLGNTGYGVWTLVVSLTGYFGMLDVGLRQSVGRFVARYVALKDEDNVNRTINSALTMLATGGFAALLAAVLMNFCFGIFKIEHQFESAARIALLIAGVNISLALPMSVFNAVLFALERFDVVTGVTVLGALTRTALVVIFLNMGYGVIALALVTLASSSAEYCASALCARSLYPPLKLGRRFVDWARCKELFGFGIFRFIWIVANQLIFYTDSVVIGIFLSAAAITYYTIAGSLINYGRNIVSLAADTFYPAATRLDAKNDLRGLQELQIFGTKISLLIGLPLCIGFLFLGKQFIILWMGKAYAVSAVYLMVLTIPQFTSMSQYISALILVGMARHRILAFVAMAEGLTNLVLSIILVRKIGLVGVAWGTVIPHAVSTAIILPTYTLRTLKMSWPDYIARAFVRPVICAAPIVGVCYMFSVAVQNPSWILFGGEVIVVGVIFGITSYLVCLTEEQRSIVLDKVRMLMRRAQAVGET